MTFLGEAFKKYIIPRSIVSFNEMMVRFIRQFAAIIKLPNKPVLEGFKILSLY